MESTTVHRSQKVKQILSELEFDISQGYSEYIQSNQDKISLNFGTSGLALFYGYLYKHTNKKEHLELCEKIIDKGVEKLSESTQPSLFAGFTGFLWVIQHLINIDVLNKEAFDNLHEMNQVINKASDYYFKHKQYSLMYGLIGNGVYFMEIIKSLDDDNYAKESLRKIVKYIDELSIVNTENEIYWIDHVSTNHHKSDSPLYNLGIPHGIPGIILFLCKMMDLGIETKICKKLIHGSCLWLIAQKSNFYNISFFPPMIGDQYKPHLTRLAWSYGDLCSAIAFAKASRVLNDDKLFNEAKKTAMITVNRDIKNSIIHKSQELETIDVGICKGSSGIILLYIELIKVITDSELKESLSFWIDQTFHNKLNNQGIAGYYAYVSNNGEDGHWSENVGFLDGISGTGLTLLSLIQEKNEWKNLLLL